MFAYGTLMVGDRNHHEVVKKNLLKYENASISGQLHYYADKDYPALTVGNQKIHGQLFYFDNMADVLAVTNEIEGYIAPHHEDNMYHLEIAEVETESGDKVLALVYRINPSLLEQASNGFEAMTETSWKLFKNRKLDA